MALKKLQLEVVPVIRAEGALADVADDGVRLPSSTDDQLQQLAVEVRASHSGMKCSGAMGMTGQAPCSFHWGWQVIRAGSCCGTMTP